MRNWLRAALVGMAYLVLYFVGMAAFGAAMTLPSYEPEPVPKPTPGAIDPKPSGVIHDARELPYKFELPTGFAPQLNTLNRDARLVPEPWLPTSAHIELDSYALNKDVSSMDAQQLRRYAPTVLRWNVKEPAEVLTAADGSPALQYQAPESTHIIVLHRRTAVHVHTQSYTPLSDEQNRVLREAARTVALSMRFR